MTGENAMRRRIRAIGVATSIAALVLAGCVAGGPDNGGRKVFFFLPNTTTTRFVQRDAPMFTEFLRLFAPDVSVTLLNAGGDPATQESQVNDAIAQGASAIVLVSADANRASAALAAAHQASVPVVLYDHDAVGGPADGQIVFDSLEVGRQQGMRAAELINAMPGQGLKVARVKGHPGDYGTIHYQAGQDEFLQPLIDSGKIEVICDQNINNWDPVQGQSFAEACLANENNAIDMFITMNDDLAGGIVAALDRQELVGRIPVTGGQDANLAALQLIAQNKLDNTIYKNLSDQAKAAAQVTTSILDGNGVPENMINGTIDNQYMDVPTVFLPVQNITRDNLQVVVDAGFYTWQQICEPAPISEVCKEHD